jgi:hypothetical protein
MSNFFTDVVGDLDNLEQDLLGPDYKYWKQIKTPEELGMSKDGNLGAIANDVTAMMKYTQFLIAGGGASTVDGPIGDRFFLQTGAKCRDTITGKQVQRSIYIDNIPSGKIPFISAGLGENFTALEGLLPGTVFGLAKINPLAIFQAFMTGVDPSCQAITLPVRDVNNVDSVQTEFLVNPDIQNISPCLFTELKNPISGATMGGCNTNNTGYLGGTVQDLVAGAPPKAPPDIPEPAPSQCNVKSGFPSNLQESCKNIKEDTPCNATPFCNWGPTETFQNRYSTQSYIGDCSEIIGYLYMGLLILLVCYVLSKAVKPRR